MPFELFDKFFDRLTDMKKIIDIANEFAKLEKVEIGGVQGRQIGRNIQRVCTYIVSCKCLTFKNLYNLLFFLSSQLSNPALRRSSIFSL